MALGQGLTLLLAVGASPPADCSLQNTKEIPLDLIVVQLSCPTVAIWVWRHWRSAFHRLGGRDAAGTQAFCNDPPTAKQRDRLLAEAEKGTGLILNNALLLVLLVLRLPQAGHWVAWAAHGRCRPGTTPFAVLPGL
ncbi:MAG: hypothetical protein CM15mP89_2320 [Gammaproteobacteria bacterium]|nr:MAG: hypothetical protein CM15mP89_2320 [Gammaproteobacteria bacterium]